MIAGLDRIRRVSADALRRSVPISSGADIIAHMLMWVSYSRVVMPPLPISSMSGSFQAPGRAAENSGAFCVMIELRLVQLSWMSSVVRHRLPTSAAHSHGWTRPHSHSEYTIGRPVARSASPIAV